MSQDKFDFSGLFKLDVLIHLDITAYSFYELGLKKFLALSSDKELVFLYINSQGERFDRNYDWDFVDNPVYCLCFEPSGTWVLIVSEDKVLLVPFLPLFTPQSCFDHKWSLSSVTVLPLENVCKPTAVTWWLTKESDNILIIGSKIGIITFYSLETQSVVGECKVSDVISDLQICFDDSLDLLTLLITGAKSQQWKLILEHRSFCYNWLQQSKSSVDIKRDSFISYIKQLSKDRITLFTQSSSKESKPQSVEYVLKPTEYLPNFRKGSNNWALTAQYVNGRHFLTAFEVNEGTIILESPEQDVPSRTLRPLIKKDGLYCQGMWSQRLIFLLRNNELEVHSSAFSVIQGDGVYGSRNTLLWSAELIGKVQRAYLVSTREPPSTTNGWKEPTFMCDLQLPRFNLEQCLVITKAGAYLLNTVSPAAEWLVSTIMSGGGGAEQSAAALFAALPPLLRAAADLLLARGSLAPAVYLYALSQSQPDGWIARLGVFGRLQELSLYKHTAGGEANLGNPAATIRLLAVLMKVANNKEEQFDTDIKLTNLTSIELEELASTAAALGLWRLVPTFSIQRGKPSLLLSALKNRGEICRGAIDCLVNEESVVPLLLEENAQWLFDYIAEKCRKFDTEILKRLCLWLCPLQDQLCAVMRDLKQGINTVYTARMKQLISTFMQLAAAIESRDPSYELNPSINQQSDTWINNFVPQRGLSCGLAHWAVVDDGNAKVMLADTPVNTELIGRVISVACGRHHTILLTESGVYTAGDNSYGQLGSGAAWAGGVGDGASAAGAPARVAGPWRAPVVAVAAGHYHCAAIDAGGLLYTWGWGVHGQLGLGTIEDEWAPQVVTKLQGRKVISVGCGACHTVALTISGSLYAFGASIFGQLGTGNRDKSNIPLKVILPDKVVNIAVGYFHNLALTATNTLYTWGSSPKCVRAAQARRAASPSPPSPAPALQPPSPAPASAPALPIELHLSPQVVPLSNVVGQIVQMSAGWHHSCIISSTGQLYAWGLNFNGQLGIGDRKHAPEPTEIKIVRDSPVSASEQSSTTSVPKVSTSLESIDGKTKALVACGGDFTIYIDDDGYIYSAGNNHLESTKELSSKLSDRVIMMKTTKRVIKIPASRSNNKGLAFTSIDRIDIMFPFDIHNESRIPTKTNQNPLTSPSDFKKKTWSDEVMLALKPWINKECLADNNNMAAKLAYHDQEYSECLRLLLNNLKQTRHDDNVYFAHTDCLEEHNKDAKHSLAKDELKIVISNIMSKRIKDISLSILNEQPYPLMETDVYKTIPCCCNEQDYNFDKTNKTVINIKEQDLSIEAASIIDKCMSIFPVHPELWETCFRLSKNFYLQNNLSVTELETVLRKYMELDASAMASAIMYSNDCVQYNKILSPKFYLNMCSEIMDAWS